ncbi:KWG Leptospira [Porphyromonas macacae]|uniref:KWG Leptospira n=1 Tax=Porphyromonas macacae TaxID=28115 RepID=A0A379E7H9_9PORP|nr:WG repeat-containing protein [Porphyromonas macacae]SUB88626.1 KWG Leptospira [Porphyromonas macacae]
MKKLIFFFLILAQVYCSYSQTLYKAEKNGLYGYVDDKGREIVPCKYAHAYTDTIKNLGFVFEKETEEIVCFNNRGRQLFYVFQVDNGPDYVEEGLFRIIDKNKSVGFADTLGNIVIPPKFAFAFPFKGGKAKVTFTGKAKDVPFSNGEKHYWDSEQWFFISKPFSCPKNHKMDKP